jgi:amino acid adenylation domain-containing protein
MSAAPAHDIATAPWPPVLLPTDRPRRPGVRARYAAVATVARAEFATVPDSMLFAGLAAVLFRYTGQHRVGFDYVAPDGGTVRARCVVTGESTLSELTVEQVPVDGDSSEFQLAVRSDTVRLHYDHRLFDPATAARLLDHLRTLVLDATHAPQQPVARLRLLPDAEAHRILVQWNRTETDLPHNRCLHEAFEAAADRAPQAVAAVHGARRWTYAQIDAAANRLARHLRGLGVGRETRVAVCLERSADLLITVLGIMKAGGTYVPLDPGYPLARLHAMVVGTSCEVLVSRTALAANLPETSGHLVLLDRDADALATQPDHRPDAAAGPDNLCYVIHTSGSTGAPKPIALRHRGVMNNIADLNSRFRVGPGDSVLALSSPSFDMSVYEFLGVTAAGGTVVIPDRDRIGDPAHWAELLAGEHITIWNSAPALLGLLTDHLEQAGGSRSLPRLRLALLGGDWVPVTLPDRVRAIAPELRCIVMGGATESSIHSTIYEVVATDPHWTSIPYGRPMANQRTYILDDHLQPVPSGVPGELYLAGIGLARGYLDQPERTAERFIEWSHSWSGGAVTGERLYRTGDVARFRADGMIELLGRADFQVKINGLRVELGEIEAVLRGHPLVRQAVVVAVDGRLIAYFVPVDPVGRDNPADDLPALAARRLPAYMVPAVFVRLDQLPLTPNGKLDRKGLPQPDLPGTEYRAPRSTVERVFAEVFAEVLGRPWVGVDDDFIATGGDSVRAIQVVLRTRARGVGITAQQVLQLRTIAAIAPAATAVTDERAAGPLVVVTEDDRAALTRRYPQLSDVWPLTPMQSGMLFESMLNVTRSDTYLAQVVYHWSGPIDADRMRAAGRALLDRHPSLRTAFATDATGTPVQVVMSDVEPPWWADDFAGEPDGEAAFRRFLAEDRAKGFDPATAPLLRLALVRFGPQRARLVLTAHHLLIDGWSEQVLADDLVRLYAGMPLEPARPFSDFLAWLSRQDRARSAAAWATELDGVDGPTALAPADVSRRRVADIVETVLPLTPGELTGGAQSAVTANTVVQAAWAIVLAALTGRDEVVFGATVAGRPGELAGVESMVGLLINTIPVRALVRPQRTARDLLLDLQRRQTALVDHQHLGLSEIHQAEGVGMLFDTMVAFQSYPRYRTGTAAAEITKVDSHGVGSYPLCLLVEDDRVTVQYDRNMLDGDTVVDIGTRFVSIARQLTADGDRRIGTLEGLPAPLRLVSAEPVTTAFARRYRPGRTEWETALCTLYAEILGVERVGVYDDYFALGGNSLKATRIIGRMQELGLAVSISEIFEYSTIAKLSGRVKTAKARPSLRRMAVD